MLLVLGALSLTEPRTLRFKEELNSSEPKELLTTEEYEELRALCRQSQKAERAEQAQETEQERPPGEEMPVTPEGADTVSLKTQEHHAQLKRKQL